MLMSLSLDDALPGQLDAYCADCFFRAVHTYGLARDLRGRCLELGANPYFITTLLQEFTGLELELANYVGPDRPGRTLTQTCTYRHLVTNEVVRRDYTSSLFNMEAERFPYPDGSFDCVLFCEIIEHLLMDPVRVLLEIRRVLRPDGRLVLTTPNVNRLENVLRMVAGVNIYDPYSGFGPYGRHNREYNKHELHLLLGYLGFEIETMFTADAHHVLVDRRALEAVAPLVRFREHDLGQYIFVCARVAGEPGAKKPSFLYRSYPAEELMTLE